jgi:prepilin-type N-terminal cleavage/methylation domain-containing protein
VTEKKGRYSLPQFFLSSFSSHSHKLIAEEIMEKNTIHNGSRRSGFTLIEVLVATTVMAIILAAVATLASAMSNADRETKNMSEQQAQIRYTTMRISELIRNASLIVPVNDPRIGFCVWTDSNQDGRADGTELVYIEIDIALNKTSEVYLGNGWLQSASGQSAIEMLEFLTDGVTFTISEIEDATVRASGTFRVTSVIPECSNAEVFVDNDRKFVSLKFTVNENGRDIQYQISKTRRCSAEYVLDSSGELIYPDTDDD